MLKYISACIFIFLSPVLLAQESCKDDLLAIRHSDSQTVEKISSITTSLEQKCGQTFEYLAEMGSYYSALSEYEKAEQFFHEIINTFPSEKPIGMIGLVHIALEQKDYSSARDQLLQITQEYPNWGPGYMDLGWTYLISAQYEDALSVLQKGVVVQPNSYDMHAYLGFSHYYLDQPQKALDAFEVAYRLNNKMLSDISVMVIASKCYIQLGNIEKGGAVLTVLKTKVEGVESDQAYIEAVQYYNESLEKSLSEQK